MELTKDSLKAFKIIYCEYKCRRKAGFSKSESLEFEYGNIKSLAAFSDWIEADIKSAISELKSVKFLKENIIGDIKITNDGLVYMESKPKEFFNELSKLFDLATLFI